MPESPGGAKRTEEGRGPANSARGCDRGADRDCHVGALAGLAAGALIVLDPKTSGSGADPTAYRTISAVRPPPKTLGLRRCPPRVPDLLGGSPHNEWLDVVPGRGVLPICDLSVSSCDPAIPLTAGSGYGAAGEASNRLFVPDYTAGQVWV